MQLLDVRDERYTHENGDGTVYDCMDEGFMCVLVTRPADNSITTCIYCGDRPHVRRDAEAGERG